MNELQEGLAAARAGDRVRARALLMDYVEQNPDSEVGWLWLAAVVETPEEAEACLERALLINPSSRRARAGLEWARAQARRAAPPPPSPTPTAPPAPAQSGLLRRLGTETPPPTVLRHASPYAPTRLFTESDLARLPGTAGQPEPPPTPVTDQRAPVTGPVAPAWPPRPAEEPARPTPVPGEQVAPPREVRGEEEEALPLEPPPSLAERLSAWSAPPAPPRPSPPAREPAAPPRPAPPAREPAAQPPAPAVPATEEAEEPLGPPPSLVDRLGTWAAPPPTEPEAVLDLSRRSGRLEPPLRVSETPPVSAAPPPPTSLAERLRQLRGEPAAAPEKPVRPTATVAELMSRGQEALESGRVDEAETAFRQVLQLDPHHADAHANLAMIHYVRKHLHEAIAELKIAVQYQPEHEDAWYTLGVILNEVGRREEAIQAWRQTLRLNPDHAEAQRELEQVTRASTTAGPPTEKAIRCPNCGGTILTAVSTCPHCDYELFTICPRCKEYVSADSRLCPACGYTLKGLTTSTEGPRQEAEVHTRLGLAHLEDGRVADALREWQEASAIDPTYAVPHFYLGLLFVEQRQIAQAIESFQRAVRLDPDYAEAYLELGLIYLAQNKRPLAQRAFEECLKHRPPVEVQREAQLHLERLRGG